MADYLKDKVVIVTGAGSGFGKLTAQKLINADSKVVGADIKEERLEKISSELSSENFKYKKTDISNEDEVKELMQFAVDQFGRVDVLVNNAGIMPLDLLSDHKKAMEAWKKCIDVNFKGTLYGIASVYDQMIKQGKGQIINVSSIYGDIPVYGSTPYGATKKAVAFMTDALRNETRGQIKFTTIRPTGSPTHLNDNILDFNTVAGAIGHNDFKKFAEIQEKFNNGKLNEDEKQFGDANNIKNMILDPKYLADNIVYAINQPDGVCVSDITVRSSNDYLII